jgi:outer membrane protein assembly factor BamB
VILAVLCGTESARAQLGAGLAAEPGAEFELAEAVTLDRADTAARTYLKRVRQYVADAQWGEATETLRRVMEESGDKMFEVSPTRYLSVRDYCHLQLSSLPPDGLAVYRSQLDPAARAWYEQGIAERNAELLHRVVKGAFASSWGDNALLALGEIALESGDYAAARAYWERIIPVEPPPGRADTWLSVPDTDLDLASVRARLVLASILEGSEDRARSELARLAELHPRASGRLGGREVEYVNALASLLERSSDWPPPAPNTDWPTFGGSPQRNAVASEPIDPARVVWRAPLRETIPANASVWGSDGPTPRVAEDARRPLSYHPIVVGDLVLVNHPGEILALNVHTGESPWGPGTSEIFRNRYGKQAPSLQFGGNLGVPRFTMTAFDGKLYARMGTPITSRPRDPQVRGEPGHLVCLDLEAEGRLVWRIEPENSSLAFDGAPVTDGVDVYVAMRQSDIQPQLHVASFDASTGRQRWRRFVASGETPARGMLFETTHNLLTLCRDTLYLNTNLGVVAALSVHDGQLQWVALYPRTRKGNLLAPDAHWCRDLNPCLYDRGTLLVAPADNPRIFALDAVTGQILWYTGVEVEDVVHLLGVSGDRLIAGGSRLYWIGLRGDQAGKVLRVVPDSHEKLGYGRGLLAGDCVWWPTRERIYVFDAGTGRQRKVIPLVPRGALGGNLVVGGSRLLIAGTDELIALGVPADVPQPAGPRVAFGRDPDGLSQ